MSYFACTACGDAFWREDSETWKVRCYSCWKARRWQQETSADRSSFDNEFSRGYAAGRAAGLAEAVKVEPAVAAIDKTRLRQLLQLCHPDKHAGGELAGEVTVWLLELRKQVA